jgi:cytochrome c
MAFAGIKNNKDRADVIAWLRTQSDKPPPLPSPDEVKAEQAQAQKATAAPPGGEQKAEQKAGQPAAPQPDFGALVAKADPAKGKADTETQCAICHTFGKGEPAKIGPNLYGVVGAPRARMAGFDYTDGLKKLGGTWTYDELNQWLTNPMAVVPGTRMIFPGVKSEKERANIVAYLRTLSDHPEPLPQAAPAAGGQAGAPSQPAGPQPGETKVNPAPEGTSGEQAAPAAGGISQETPAEKASPGGAGTSQGQPQAGAPGAPAPEQQKP